MGRRAWNSQCWPLKYINIKIKRTTNRILDLCELSKQVQEVGHLQHGAFFPRNFPQDGSINPFSYSYSGYENVFGLK